MERKYLLHAVITFFVFSDLIAADPYLSGRVFSKDEKQMLGYKTENVPSKLSAADLQELANKAEENARSCERLAILEGHKAEIWSDPKQQKEHERQLRGRTTVKNIIEKALLNASKYQQKANLFRQQAAQYRSQIASISAGKK